MNRFVKSALLAAAAAAAVAAPLASASADGWRHDGWGRPYYHHHHDHGDAIAAGVVGLAAGALVGAALSQPQQPVYEPAPVYDAPPPPPPAYYPAPRQVTYRAGYEPWTRGWYAYCSDRFRSFNPRTGTYRGNDGQDHFCSAN